MLVPHFALAQFDVFMGDFSFERFESFKLDPTYPDHVADYAYFWLAFGRAAPHCGNDFGVFLSTFALIVTMWVENPLYPSRLLAPPDQAATIPQAKKVLVSHGKCMNCVRVFDPQFFALLAVDPDYMIRAGTDPETGLIG